MRNSILGDMKMIEKLNIWVKFRLQKNGVWEVWIKGETYKIKEELKAMGYRWDPDARLWYKEWIEGDEEIKRLCQMARERKWFASFYDLTTDTITYNRTPRVEQMVRLYYGR